MTLLIGIPFREGFAVASDLVWTEPTKPTRLAKKMHVIGGRLFTYSGQCAQTDDEFRVAWDLADFIAGAAPDELELQHVPALAEVARTAMQEKWARRPPEWRPKPPYEDGCMCVFWLPDHRFARFKIDNVDGRAVASEVTIDARPPDEPLRPVMHGNVREFGARVVQAGRLSARSVRFLGATRPLVGQTSREDAIDLAVDMQRSSAGQLFGVGGGIDLRIVHLDGSVEEIASADLAGAA